MNTKKSVHFVFVVLALMSLACTITVPSIQIVSPTEALAPAAIVEPTIAVEPTANVEATTVVEPALMTAKTETGDLVEPETTTSPTKTAATTPQLIWTDTYSKGLLEWRLDLDPNVGCPESDITGMDINYSIIQDSTSPMDDKSVLFLEANSEHKKAFFVNGIAHKWFDAPDGSLVILETNFRIPEGADPELINSAIEVVYGGIGHFGEIFWGKKAGAREEVWHIYTRTTGFREIYLAELPKDNNWHKGVITVFIDRENDIYNIVSLRVDDGDILLVNAPMAMPKEKISWDESTQVYLETHNRYSCTDPTLATYGASLWDGITISYMDLP